MATVTKKSANWRLFGGGGLLIAGLVWVIALVLFNLAKVTVASPWLGDIALAFLIIGLIIVALGQTGHNGAVGDSTVGRISLIGFAAGWLFYLISDFVALGSVLIVAAILVIVGGLLSAVFVYRKRVAKGVAQWFLFAPAVVGALFVAGNQGWIPPLAGQWLLALLLAVLFAITGLLYLFNDRKIG